ncbi:LOW QUALITY PROTEIN: uncharacterized protein [Amphiura filiformis]|uniref:LOW QUALITY PROTEIN: uncharacterized protein n=1 Tax=Amphiura filiformis TaxID=82378 RepID=UPI003B225D1F
MAADPEKIEQEREFKTENRPASLPSTIADRLQASVSPEAKLKIQNILDEVDKFNDLEKLLLYLKLPAGITDANAAPTQSKTPTPVAVARAEQTHAFNWIRSHLEESSETSLPKHEVYEDYKSYCENSSIHVLSPADFGKIMKSMFPNVKGRRLGTRGNSRYCYSGIRKKTEVKPPILPSLDSPQKLSRRDLSSPSLCWKCQNSPDDEQVDLATSLVVCEWATKIFTKQFSSILDVADHLTHNSFVSKSMAALTVISYMADRNKKSGVDGSLLKLTQSEEDRHRETKHQLQRKIQHSQLIKMKQQQEHRKKLQSRLGTTESHDRTKHSQGSERSQSVPADRFFSESDSNGSESGNSDGKDGTEVATSNSNLPISSIVSQQPPAGVKDSPNKRRYTPIQPKTPVRGDNNTIKAVPINIPGVSKGQQNQIFLLRNPNGTARFATEVIQNGQKVLQVIDSPIVQQPASAAASKPVASPTVTTKPMSQIVLVRQAPPNTNLAQGAGVSPVVQTSKAETIANAAILVSPSHHVLVSPVKTPSNARVNASVGQIVSTAGHVVVQNTPIYQKAQGKTFVNTSSIVSPPVQQAENTMMTRILSPTPCTHPNQPTIKKEIVSRGPTPSFENMGSPPATPTSMTYVRAIVRVASPEMSEIQPNVTPGGLVTTQTVNTMTTNSVTSPQSTAICLPAMSAASNIPHTGSAAALLMSLSSTVHSNNQQQVTSQIPVQRSSVSQALQSHQAVLKQPNVTASSAAAPHTKVLSEINDTTTSQLRQVAASLQLQQSQLLQQQQQISLQQVNLSGNPSGTSSHQAGGILKTALMSPITFTCSTQPTSVNNMNIAATSETVAKLDALQLHDNSSAAQLAAQMSTSTAGSQQQPGFIPLSGVKRLAVDPKSVFTNGTTISVGSIQQKQPIHGFAGTTVLNAPAGINQGITGQTILTSGSTAGGAGYPVNIVKSGDGTVSVIPVSQFSHVVSSPQIVNTARSVGGSVPCTPTRDMQSPIPMMLTINPQASSIMQQSSGHATPIMQQSSGHVTPIMQQSSGHVTPINVMQQSSGHVTPINVMQQSSGHVTPINVMQQSSGHVTPVNVLQQSNCGGTTTPIPMCIGSVPPSPVDVSAGFIPIQQDLSRVASNASPVKRTKVKPRPTHPKQQGTELRIQGNQFTSNFQQTEIASKPNFAAPSRKRSPSGQRRASANPYPLPPPGPRQTTPVASPCNSRCNTPVSPATPGNPNLDSISMPPPSPGLPPFDNTVMGGSRQDMRNRSASPALWNAQGQSRRRNPSGPPTYTVHSISRQQSLEWGHLQTDLNVNLNQIVIDQNGRPRIQQLSQRSQSVPLPDLPEARIFNFQQLQQVPSASNTTQSSTTPSQVSNQDTVLQASLSGTELRGIQINDTCSNYNAKRNLTLELQEIEVTEDDFAVGPANSQNFLSPDGNSQPASGLDAFNELLNSNTSHQSDQNQEGSQGSSWTSSRRGDPTLASAPSGRGGSDLNVGFEIASSDPVVSTGSGLPEDQTLLFNQTMNGDASNSTSSTLNDDIPNMEDPLSEFGAGTSFDLSWQMGSNSSLSTLECGM